MATTQAGAGASSQKPPAGKGSAQVQSARDRASLTPQEYLDQSGVSAYLKDATTLLLENRPKNAVAFLADYFKNVIAGSSPHLRSYRYLRLSKRGRMEFIDNLAAAYQTLEAKKSGKQMVTVKDAVALARMICNDLPPNIVTLISMVLDKKESSIVSFAEFSSAMTACLAYEELLDRVQSLFAALREVEGTSSLRARKDDILTLIGHAVPAGQSRSSESLLLFTEGLDTIAKKVKEFPSIEEGRIGQQDFFTIVLESVTLPTAVDGASLFKSSQARDMLLSL
uniref:Centriolar satellite-associated tubulin polyglutamylase complex regulator 1 n=1 Tax=Palpitomonas bilix TaxID=652834 RepID=A0A7S3GE48_9EUKA